MVLVSLLPGVFSASFSPTQHANTHVHTHVTPILAVNSISWRRLSQASRRLSITWGALKYPDAQAAAPLTHPVRLNTSIV